MNTPSQDIAHRIDTTGYVSFDGLFARNEVDVMRNAIESRYREIGSPRTYANPPVFPAEDCEVSVVGLVMHKLGLHCPDIAPVLFKPALLDCVERILGRAFVFEYSAAVVNDGDREFFPWHMHVGGVDNAWYRKTGTFPRFAIAERITVLTYMNDLTESVGRLLAYPRGISEPTEPPFDPNTPSWPGADTLACTAGSVVMMEQNVWHAAEPKASPGLRAFIACYFRRASTKPASWQDESWAGAPLGSLHQQRDEASR